MNWAPKLAVNSSSFVVGEPLLDLGVARPNTFTSAWPVKASSTWAFSAPVWLHWAMKRCLERLVMNLIIRIDTGMVTSAIDASNGEMVNIMITTPTRVSVEVSIWLSVCWRLCATLSMSLVTRLSRSPRG